MNDLPTTIVDVTYFTRGYSNGRCETNMWYWHEKSLIELCTHAEATFRFEHERERQAFTDVQLLSYMAGYMAGYPLAVAEFLAEQVTQ